MKSKLYLIILCSLISICSLKAQVRIAMHNENGVYTTPCKVNGLKLRFIFDTGASNVSISLSEALFMLKNGYMEESDLKGSSFAQLADGKVIENTSVVLREIEIGGIKLNNIEAIVIHNLTAPLLLGQSAIQKLGKFQIEGNELVILNGTSNLSQKEQDVKLAQAQLDALVIKSVALDNYDQQLYNLAIDNYHKAYELYPRCFESQDFMNFGISYFFVKEFNLAIIYLQKVSGADLNSTQSHVKYYFLASSYQELKRYDEAITFFERAISVAEFDAQKWDCYESIASIFYEKENYRDAIDAYNKAANFYCNSISVNIADLYSGKIKDDTLGYIYFFIGGCYLQLDQQEKSDSYLIKSAMMGYEHAIILCTKRGLKY